MKPSLQISGQELRRSAFTLVELLVSMAVLTMLILAVAQLTNSASNTIAVSNKQMTADVQAQTVFSQMTLDFAAMPKRKDVDAFFWKNDSGTGNDAMFFYSEGQGYYSGQTGDQFNSSQLSLVGFRVGNRTAWPKTSANENPNFTLMRVSRGLAWDGSAPSITSGESFLTIPTGKPCPDVNMSLPTHERALIGTAAPYDGSDGSADDYTNMISEGVYRIEFCFQLKDGSFSNEPVLTSGTAGKNNFTTAPPALTDDRNAGYVAGASRWWDKKAQKGYICVNAASKGAQWAGLGMTDVSAIVVAIAILEKDNRVRVKQDANTSLNQIDKPTMLAMQKALPNTIDTDPSSRDSDLTAIPPKLIGKKWLEAVNDPKFATACTIPQSVASQIRIYQRLFPLNSN
ncbi:MAG: hypothetical protein QOD99_146 [Chthoniobacter sp.]|jgi:prepilin-type N-terminal cleavage/methylation domain-containing protein|nr:hypothetical protein [Chthoniobacter sp.]